MSLNPVFSVVTVTYNAVTTLEETIISVIYQRDVTIEYIIIDGGSTDGTLDLIYKYQDKIAFVVSEPDNGIYDAMNKALDIANGDFVIFLGADDHFISHSTLSDIKKYLIDDNSVYYGNVFRNTRNDIYKGKFDCFKISLVNICHQSIFYPRNIYKKYRYDLQYKIYADYYYNLTLYPLYAFVYIPCTIAYYNCEGQSATVSDDRFSSIIDKYVKKQLGVLPWIIRKLYKMYKWI